MKILIIGHNSFEGAWLAKKALLMGAEVWGWDYIQNGVDPSFSAVLGGEINKIKQQFGDIFESEIVQSLIQQIEPDTVILLLNSKHSKLHLNDLEYHHKMSLETLVSFMGGASKVRTSQDPLFLIHCSERQNQQDFHSLMQVQRLQTVQFFQQKNPRQRIYPVVWGSVVGVGDLREGGLFLSMLEAIQAGQTFEVRKPNSVRSFQNIETLSNNLLKAVELLPKKAGSPYIWNLGPQSQEMYPILKAILILAKELGVENKVRVREELKAGGLSYHPSPDCNPFYSWLGGDGVNPRDISDFMQEVAHFYREYFCLQ